MTNTERQNGDERDLATYEKDLAAYLQERIKPGLSSSAIPLLARSIAKDIARGEPSEASDGKGSEARADGRGDDEQLDQSDPQGDDDDDEQDLETDEQSDPQRDEEQSDFEANMHELQADLGDEWILHFSVQGDDGWLTAERQVGTLRVEAPDAQRLVSIIDAVDEFGGRQP